MNARRKLPRIGKEGLSIGKDLGVGWSRNNTVEIVIGHDFDQFTSAVREMSQQRKHMMTAMSPGGLISGAPGSQATHHDIVYVSGGSRSQEVSQLRIDFGRAT